MKRPFILTLIWVGFLGVRFEVGVGVKLQGIDQKSENLKYPRQSFAQVLETGASKEYQIWQERL